MKRLWYEVRRLVKTLLLTELVVFFLSMLLYELAGRSHAISGDIGKILMTGVVLGAWVWTVGREW